MNQDIYNFFKNNFPYDDKIDEYENSNLNDEDNFNEFIEDNNNLITLLIKKEKIDMLNYLMDNNVFRNEFELYQQFVSYSKLYYNAIKNGQMNIIVWLDNFCEEIDWEYIREDYKKLYNMCVKNNYTDILNWLIINLSDNKEEILNTKYKVLMNKIKNLVYKDLKFSEKLYNDIFNELYSHNIYDESKKILCIVLIFQYYHHFDNFSTKDIINTMVALSKEYYFKYSNTKDIQNYQIIKDNLFDILDIKYIYQLPCTVYDFIKLFNTFTEKYKYINYSTLLKNPEKLNNNPCLLALSLYDRKDFEILTKLTGYSYDDIKINNKLYYNNIETKVFNNNKPSLFQPSLNQPSLNQPSLNQLSLNQPSLFQLSLNQLSLNQPSLNQPSLFQPSLNQPSLFQLSLNQPSLNQPSLFQPSLNIQEKQVKFQPSLRSQEPKSFQNVYETPLLKSKHTQYLCEWEKGNSWKDNLEEDAIILPRKEKSNVVIREKDNNFFDSELYKYYDEEELRIPRILNKNNPEINRDVFSTSVNYLYKICDDYQQSLETFFLTVEILKYFIVETKNIKRSIFQLVGLGCLLIASKYNEVDKTIYIVDISRICKKIYMRKEIIEMEEKILFAIDFNVILPTSYIFICRYLKNADLTITQQQKAKYICLQLLSEYLSSEYLPSEIAAAAIYIVRDENYFEGYITWTDDLIKITGYYEKDIRNLSYHIENLLNNKLDIPKDYMTNQL